jgi:hypothetical protein
VEKTKKMVLPVIGAVKEERQSIVVVLIFGMASRFL